MHQGGPEARLGESELVTFAHTFAHGGGIADAVGAVDWSSTPLGPIADWSETLRAVADLVLCGGFPQCLLWGPDPLTAVMLYNEPFVAFLGRRHPCAMGATVRDALPELSDFLHWSLRQVWDSGRPVIGRDLALLVERTGRVEEMFASISFSPVMSRRGIVRGAVACGIETTVEVVSRRREHALRAISESAGHARNETEFGREVTAALTSNHRDLPFALLYLVDEDARIAHLQVAVGIDSGTSVSPREVHLRNGGGSPWPLARVADERRPEVVSTAGLPLRGMLPVAAAATPEQALVVPVFRAEIERAVGVLVLGISPIRPFDDAYRGFGLDLAREIALSLSSVRAYVAECRRADSLAEVDRAKTMFLSSVSHEFRTPLTLILGPIEESLTEPLGPELRQRLEIVRRSGLRLLKLVDGLIEFARLGACRSEAVFEPTDLATLTRELSVMFAPAAKRAGLSFVIDCQPLPEPVWVARDAWETIVLNLLSNAYKFTLKGEIVVSMRAEGRFAKLCVRDTGAGIAPEHLPQIFGRFQRIHAAAARAQEGLGIGLALVKELAEVHGGSAEVASVIGRGSAFTVMIPFGTSHLPADRARTAGAAIDERLRASAYLEEVRAWSGPQEALTEGRLGAPRVLVAENDVDLGAYLTRLLARMYRVECVRDGETALARVRAENPDLVLADLAMPGLDGIALVRELRRDPKTRGVPFLLLSARVGEERLLDGLTAGADDFLLKPFSARELLARLKTHMELARARREAAESKAKDEFLGIISHEFRTPLTSLRLNVAMIERTLTTIDPPAADRLAAARSAIGRMEGMIEDLLCLSEITTGEFELEVERCDLREVARAAVESERSISRRQVSLELPDQPVMLLCDPLRIGRAIANLLGNALKFSPQDQPVALRLSPRGNSAILKVSDRGPGIPPDRIGELFRPFQRIGGVEIRVGSRVGFGVGLFVAKTIVERHGGTLSVESAPGAGTSFSIELRVEEPVPRD